MSRFTRALFTPFLLQCLLLSSPLTYTARGAENPRLCAALLTMAKVIQKREPNLHTQQPVVQAQRRLRSLGLPTSQRPAERIAEWLLVLEQTHNLEAQARDTRLQRLQSYYHRMHVITEANIPEGYFELQRRIAREQGRGNITLTPEARSEIARILILDQKSSLNEWLNYLLSADAKDIPFALKYWTFTEVVRMAPFDPDTGTFPRRNRGTVALFPELNREALRLVLAQRQNSQDNETFTQLYGAAVNRERELALNASQNHGITEGQWIIYPQGSHPDALVNSLRDRCTGWCTAQPGTAGTQLSAGAFHVYYSRDREGNPTVPRIAIRMEGSRIAEVRGVAKNQHLDSSIAGTPILTQKLETFGIEGERFQRATRDMALMTQIERKSQRGESFTREELRFLYQIDSKIETFGYGADPRVAEITQGRDLRQDLSFAIDVAPERISFTAQEALSGNIALHYGSLDLSYLTALEGITLPHIVIGKLILTSLLSPVGLTLPHTLRGNLYLSLLTSADGLTLPHTLNGSLYLNSLKSATGLTLPHSMSGDLILSSLPSVRGLTLPHAFTGTLDLSALTSAQGIVLPTTFSGRLLLNSLTTAQGLVLPPTFSGNLLLDSLKSAQGLILPHTFSGLLGLGSLTSAEGLTLPHTFSGTLNLTALSSAQGLILPHTFSGTLNLTALSSAEGLTLPHAFSGTLNLTSLASAEGLTLPHTFSGTLNLTALSSAQGLTLPHTFDGMLHLTALSSARGLILPQTFSGTLGLNSLKSAQGLILPHTFSGSLILSSLKSAQALRLPHTFNGYLYLDSLTSVRGLILPPTFGGHLYLNSRIRRHSLSLQMLEHVKFMD